jgi:cytochrome c oxidase cbb3-type subunit 4
MDAVLFHIIWTVVAFVVFIAIFVWAWSNKRKHAFDEAARLPLEDEEYVKTSEKAGDKNDE